MFCNKRPNPTTYESSPECKDEYGNVKSSNDMYYEKWNKIKHKCDVFNIEIKDGFIVTLDIYKNDLQRYNFYLSDGNNCYNRMENMKYFFIKSFLTYYNELTDEIQSTMYNIDESYINKFMYVETYCGGFEPLTCFQTKIYDTVIVCYNYCKRLFPDDEIIDGLFKTVLFDKDMKKENAKTA